MRATARTALTILPCILLAVPIDAGAGPKRLPARTVQCGETIAESVRIANPLRNCPGDGLVVGAPNVTIDLGGHRVDGTDVVDSAGIDNSAGHAGVRIQNGMLTDFADGVHLANATGNELSALRVFENDVGIRVAGGGQHEIRGCFVRGNELGIRIDAGSNDNVLVGNDASENRVDGFYVEASERNAFTANHADGNGTYGFEIFGANDNVFRGNTANGNSDNGFTLDDGASDNVLKGNRAFSNGEQGILVFSGTGNVLQKNTVEENGENGILSQVGTLALRGNRANRNGFVGGGAGDDVGLGISVPAGAVSAANQAAGNDDPNECESADVECHVP